MGGGGAERKVECLQSAPATSLTNVLPPRRVASGFRAAFPLALLHSRVIIPVQQVNPPEPMPTSTALRVVSGVVEVVFRKGSILQNPQVKFQPGPGGVVAQGWRDSPLPVLSDCQGTGLLSPCWSHARREGCPHKYRHPHTHLHGVAFYSESISSL